MDEELRWHLLMTKKFERQIADAFEIFRKQGIEPLLIKGWAVARYYPRDKPRFFGDVDIAVAAEHYDKASRMVTGPELAFLPIDLHRELRSLDTLPWKAIIDRSEVIETVSGNIRVPCGEDHLRILCVHWLTDGGAYRDKLWDVYHLIDNRRDDFDWDRAVGSVNPVRQGWIKTTIAIAHKYLGLPVDDLPFAQDVRKVPIWIERALAKEWATDVRLLPLHTVLRDHKKFWQQIMKRVPPNPIQATIEMEGRFDARTRFFYQIGNYFQRLTPMTRRVGYALFQARKDAE